MATSGTTAKEWIEALELQPHPEGGFFREVYRSDETLAAEALPERFATPRVQSTSIYFLLRAGEVSALHRIKQDEIWHFHDGDGLVVHEIDPHGHLESHALGRNLAGAQRPQRCIRAGSWFGAEVVPGGRYALVGCTVAPGFEFEDLEMADRSDLLSRFPRHAEIISRLTPRA